MFSIIFITLKVLSCFLTSDKNERVTAPFNGTVIKGSIWKWKSLTNRRFLWFTKFVSLPYDYPICSIAKKYIQIAKLIIPISVSKYVVLKKRNKIVFKQTAIKLNVIQLLKNRHYSFQIEVNLIKNLLLSRNKLIYINIFLRVYNIYKLFRINGNQIN